MNPVLSLQIVKARALECRAAQTAQRRRGWLRARR
jgi:hypothetical protein